MKARKQMTWGNSPFCLFRTRIFSDFVTDRLLSIFFFMHSYFYFLLSFRYFILSHVMHLATITLILVTLQKETNHDLAEKKQNGSTAVM